MEELNFQFYILHIEKFLNLVLWGSHFHICSAVQHVDIRYSHGSNLNNAAKMVGFLNFDIDTCLLNLMGSSVRSLKPIDEDIYRQANKFQLKGLCLNTFLQNLSLNRFSNCESTN